MKYLKIEYKCNHICIWTCDDWRKSLTCIYSTLDGFSGATAKPKRYWDMSFIKKYKELTEEEAFLEML